MAQTVLSDLWVPDVWVRGMDETVRTLPTLLTSGAVVRSPQLDEIASGAGVSAEMPFFRDATDGTDAIQVEDTAPTIGNVTQTSMVAPILNRVSATGATALSAAVSGSDPVGYALRALTLKRMKQRHTTALNMLRGVMATALSAAMINRFLETTVGQNSTHLIDSDVVTDAITLMGENAANVTGGLIFMHPNIRGALTKLDNISFERDSVLGLTIERYRGLQVVLSLNLSRAGTTSGTVYDTYIIGPNAIGYGEKPQAGDTIDVSSLQYYEDKPKNNAAFFDRTRFVMHINGTKWIGTPAGQSATNAELATAGNWSLVFGSVDRCGIVGIRSNG